MNDPGKTGLFIGVGFQKCATTEITDRLSQHPKIWTHPVRELRYWNTFFRNQPLPPQAKYLRQLSSRLLEDEAGGPDWRDDARRLEAWARYARCSHRGAEDYLGLFESRDPEATIWGEISPNYALLSAGELAKVYEWLGRPRLFVIMREPVARALSQINHETRLRPENVSSTERQIKFLESDKMREMSNYPRIIEALRSLPDQENVGFFFFEDFVGGMEEFFRSFCAFLGVPYRPVLARPMPRPVKKDYKSALSPRVHERAADLYGGIRADVARLVGRTPAAWDVAPALR